MTNASDPRPACRAAALSALVLLAALPAVAEASGRLIVELAPATKGLGVTSPAIGADGRIAARTSAYGANRPPALNWTPAQGAKAYAVVLEDPDAPVATPFTHWLVWNLPARPTHFDEGHLPPGAVQGRNGLGREGYFGPHPPSGVHRYHFEVFALDAPLSLAAGADREALAKALRGHVLAAGQAVGTYAAP
jgi:Raf kinase inhibitor-like YbhB/YbcL family protein